MGRASNKTPATSGQAVTGFGAPKVIVHPKEDGGKGIAAYEFSHKPFEAGQVEPSMRSNPDYLQKLADEKILTDIETRNKRDKALQAFGFGQAKIIGASQNSPSRTHKILF